MELRALIAEAVDAVRVSAPDRTITLVAPAPVTVLGDASRLRQVVDNLLMNAVRHTPAASPVETRVWSTGGHAMFDVVDHGRGIPAEDAEKIFEPFHRSDPSRARATGGVGLGLAIVSAIAKAHDGAVGVDATDGGGATFWVRLPLAPVTANGSVAPEATAGADAAADVVPAPGASPQRSPQPGRR